MSDATQGRPPEHAPAARGRPVRAQPSLSIRTCAAAGRGGRGAPGRELPMKRSAARAVRGGRGDGRRLKGGEKEEGPGEGRQRGAGGEQAHLTAATPGARALARISPLT